MQVQGRAITTFLSSAYPTEAEAEIPEREVFDKAAAVTVDQISREEAPFFVALPAKRENQFTTIQYKKPRKVLDKIRQHLKRKSMAASAIGEYTFDHFVRTEL
jgi:hypothetical protein